MRTTILSPAKRAVVALGIILAWASAVPGCLIPTTSGCVGDPVDCTIFNYAYPVGCETSSGCTVAPRCININCSRVTDTTLCTNTPGCELSLLNPTHCVQSVVSPCDAQPETACVALPSCQWGSFCGGRTHECTLLNTESSCQASYSCSWQSNSN